VEHYAGIDVSLELSSVCVVDERGKIVKEAKVASEPEALVCFFKELGFPVNRIGFEAGPLSQWLPPGLTQAGFETVQRRDDDIGLGRYGRMHRDRFHVDWSAFGRTPAGGSG
jgi:hypothetical protein